ncbi:MAG: hypothetical protein HYZ91_03915 [Candidatus Omnitrophica bacterium]|nr:hypothetical protein [Candidatus Omnitrophota bacterium]
MNHPTRRCVGLLAGGLLWLGASGSAMAAEEISQCPLCKQASDQTAGYPSKASYMLMRGAANALFGWTELLRQPANEVKGGGHLLTGIGKGVEQGMKRTLGGAAEVLTFWTPKVQHRYVHFAHDCPLCMKK